ncbi:hypothetical protein FFLO_02662 [Filobasidium floriforme]|uniref:RNA-binding S4 domain-containing protein n=1 Tax=Filobasidium floriforme TaxID=5210 RepID=A0A8K0NNZ1_9TREE|nr:uncharacterized protein HD553DRAFT_91610 [Filobasidium floriforme]KAG7561933.1 hypothetical protein FFLO_02662 [Filobasidium floriforme]KAH8089414.1 hypothetical protein HD553DRAFT_91610 [Filobasidium floriforme]
MPYRSIIARPLFDKNRALPRMSWAPENLYNLWQRVSPDGPLRSETNFTRTSLTLFQQRWRAKRLSRGYHGDHIAEQKFERWYLPDALPSIHGASSTSTSTKTSKSRELGKMVAGRTREGGRAETERTKALLEKKSRTPIGTLLYREVERRLDVLMFRACFATSVWQARQLVVHRKVRVNGVVVNNPNVRLNPGDLFSVDPQAIPMLSKQVAEQGKKQKQVVETPAESLESSGDPTSETSADTEKSDSEIKPTSKSTSKDAYFTLPPYAAPHLFIPAYLEPNFKTCACVYVRHPTARPGYSEVPSPYDADAPNMKKRRHRWMSPERQTDRK